MELIFLIIIAGISNGQAKLIASPDNVYLQPGEEKVIQITTNEEFDSTVLHQPIPNINLRGVTMTLYKFMRLLSNDSQTCIVSLWTKLPLIATVFTLDNELNTNCSSLNILITGNQLGYTQILATTNTSNVFSNEEGLVTITVLQYHWVKDLSLLCGWIYFSAWTFSFYPQIFTNMKRKSVVGLNFDFLALNELGYICYSIFNCCFYFLSSIQAEYFKRHAGATNPVLMNDVLFSVHGFLATTVMILQVFRYERGNQSVSHTALFLLSTGAFLLAGLLITATQGYVAWLDAIVWISFIKLMVTITKYIPQALMNYRKKSTEGWSIECILCDLTGSCFSLMQMALISYNCDDWVSILGDPTKFGLGMFSVGFDMIFIVQHYILYRAPQEIIKKKTGFFNTLEECLFHKVLWISENTNR